MVRVKSHFTDIFHSWVTPFVFKGSRNSRLRAGDIPPLPSHLSAESTFEEFKKLYGDSSWTVKSSNFIGKAKAFLFPRVLRVVFFMFWKQFFISQIVQLIRVIIGLFVPFLVKLILKYSLTDVRELPVWMLNIYSPWIICAVFAVLLYFDTFLLRLRETLFCEVETGVRSALSQGIYERLLKESSSEKLVPANENLINYSTIDVEGCANLIYFISFVWEPLITVGASLGVLFMLLSYPAFILIILGIVLFPVYIVCLLIGGWLYKKYLKQFGENSNIIEESFNSLKKIKFEVREEMIFKKLIKKRLNMIFTLMMYFVSIVSMHSMSFLMMIFLEIVIFALVNVYDPLFFTLENIVAAIMYIFMFAFSITLLPGSLQVVYRSILSMQRLSAFFSRKAQCIKPEILDEDSDIVISLKEALFERSEAEIQRSKKGEDVVSLKKLLVDLDIRRGELIVVCGPVGCGKTSFVQSLVGDMLQVSGTYKILSDESFRIVYCSQNPFIQNQTLSENILFGRELNEKKLRDSLRLCNLVRDVKTFPSGINTEIAENGRTLSGGQKKRLVLCRAIYGDNNEDDMIYVLDDVLNSLDYIVAKSIFEGVIMGKLKNRTRVLVTNNPEWMERADRVVVMDSMKVVSVGKFRSLMKREAVLKSLVRSNISGAEQSSPGAEESNENFDVNSNDANLKKEKLTVDEEMFKGRVRLETVIWYLRQLSSNENLCCTLFSFALVIPFLFIVEIGYAAPSVWISLWTTGTVYEWFPKLTNMHCLMIYSVFLLLIPILFLLRSLILAVFAGTGGYRIAKKNLYHLIYSPQSFFHVNPLGRIVNRVTNDQRQCDFMASEILNLVSSCFRIVLTFLMVVSSNVFIILPVGIIVVIYLILQEYFRYSARQVKRIEPIVRSNLCSLLEESLFGLPSIRLSGNISLFCKRYATKVDECSKVAYINKNLSIWLLLRMGILSSALASFVCCFIVGMKFYHAGVSALLGLTLQKCFRLIRQIQSLLIYLINVEQMFNSVERLMVYSKLKPESGLNQKVIENFPKNGNIVFEGVSMKYREHMSNYILRDLNFEINDGESVAIVGRTGSGKSSIVETIMRSVDYQEGTIRISGVDSKTISLQQLRKSIIVLTQNPKLLSGTFRWNIDEKSEFRDDEIWAVLKACQVDHIVQRFPKKLEQHVNDNLFSVGEKLLFLIARAILLHPKIIIMDELFAKIDRNVSDIILEVIDEHLSDSTKIFITHEMNRAASCDKAIVMRSGKVVESGTPRKLLKRMKNGLFAEFYNSHQKNLEHCESPVEEDEEEILKRREIHFKSKEKEESSDCGCLNPVLEND